MYVTKKKARPGFYVNQEPPNNNFGLNLNVQKLLILVNSSQPCKHSDFIEADTIYAGAAAATQDLVKDFTVFEQVFDLQKPIMIV